MGDGKLTRRNFVKVATAGCFERSHNSRQLTAQDL
jgi:hypothetical protein